jgi:glutathione S-transferase
MEQWISIESANFSPHAMKFVYQHTFKRPQEDSVLEAATQRLGVAVATMDKRLSQNAYLAGSEFSLADICYMPYFEYITGSPAKDLLLGSSNVAAWWNRVSERPAWRKVAGRA